MPSPRIPVRKLLEHISPEAQKALLFPSEGELELHLAKEGIWVLSLASASSALSASAFPKPTQEISPLQQKVLRLMKTHQAPDLVEGRFEQFLSQEEQQALRELIAQGRVEKFKSSPKYTLGIYRETRGNENKKILSNTIAVPIVEKPLEEYHLEVDGFEIIRNDAAAKQRSMELVEKLKASEVKGMKSFDGFYYVIEQALLQRFLPSMMQFMQANKKMDLDAITSHLNVPRILVRIILEFAKEEGTIIEKRKDSFAYVG